MFVNPVGDSDFFSLSYARDMLVISFSHNFAYFINCQKLLKTTRTSLYGVDHDIQFSEVSHGCLV